MVRNWPDQRQVLPGKYFCEISGIQREQNESIDGTAEQGTTVRNYGVFAS